MEGFQFRQSSSCSECSSCYMCRGNLPSGLGGKQLSTMPMKRKENIMISAVSVMMDWIVDVRYIEKCTAEIDIIFDIINIRIKLNRIVLHCAALYHTTLYYTALYCAAMYCTVILCSVF